MSAVGNEERKARFRERLAQAVRDGGGAVKLGNALGIPKSNIYNWINGTVEDPPISEVDKIARATGYDLDWIMAVEKLPASGNFSEDATIFVGAPPSWPARAPVDRGRWTVTSRVLELAGVMPGDILEFDFAEPPRTGDVVVAQLYRGDTAVTVLRLYRPPVLLAATADGRVDQAPILLDETGTSVNVRGPMVRLLRERNSEVVT